jgi:hypothetical protein
MQTYNVETNPLATAHPFVGMETKSSTRATALRVQGADGPTKSMGDEVNEHRNPIREAHRPCTTRLK